MRSFLAALGLWSGVAFLVLSFDPGGGATALLCGRLVGHGPACDAAQALANDTWWRLHTLPMLAFIGTGYAAIVILRLRRLLRWSGRPT